MKNYKEQNGCYNCKHVFMYYDYDDEDRYYCTLNAPKRPLSCSVAMGEYNHEWKDKEFAEYDRKWREWIVCREVESYGICDKWEYRI